MPLYLPLPTDTPSNDIAQYVPLLLSAIDNFMCAHGVWADEDYPQGRLYCEDLKQWIVDNVPPTPVYYLSNEIQWNLNLIVVSGNATLLVANASHVLGWYGYQNPAALNQKVRFYVSLTPGTYQGVLYHIKANNAGRVQLKVDGQNVGSPVDMYNATTVLNQETTFNFDIAAGGNHQIEFEVVSKNGSSSNYYFVWTAFAFRQSS